MTKSKAKFNPICIAKNVSLWLFLFSLSQSCTYLGYSNKSKNVNDIEIDSAHYVFSIGRVEPALRIIALFSEETGTLIKQTIPNGEWRNKGETIAELDAALLQEQIQKAQAVVNIQEKTIKLALIEVEKAKSLSDKQRQIAERSRFAFQHQQASKAQFEEQQFLYAQSLLHVKTSETQVEKQKAILEKHLSALHIEKVKLNKRKIKAPFDGKLLSLDVPIGTVVTPTIKLGDFAPEAPAFIFSDIPSKDADKVLEGQTCVLRDLDTKDTLGLASIIQIDLHYKLKDSTKQAVRTVKLKLNDSVKTYLRLGRLVECVTQIDKK